MNFLNLLTASLLVTPTAQQPVKLLSPSDVMALAAADIETVAPHIRPYCRYLSLGFYSPDTWEMRTLVLSGHLNQLSTEPGIERPVIVGNGALLRINLSYYGKHWPEVWEKLALGNPYFNIALTVDQNVCYWPGGYWCQFGRSYEPGRYRVESKQTLIPSVSPFATESTEASKGAKFLVEQTKSQAPVVDAGFFLGRSSAQFKRNGAGYYDWLGIKNRDDYEKLIGFDAKVAAKAKFIELLEAESESEVAQQARLVRLDPCLGGQYTRTLDNDEALDKKNPLRVFDPKVFEHIAEEAITPKANGFPVYLLCDQNGKLQDIAPDFIGYNQRGAYANDGRIHVCYGCIHCHFLDQNAKDGMRSFKGFVRDVLKEPRFANLADPTGKRTEEDALKFRQQFMPEIEGPLNVNRARIAQAIFTATGLESAKWAQAYATWFQEYEGRVGLAEAAATMGMTPEQVATAWSDYHRKTQALDFVLAGLLRGKRIGRKQWEEAYFLGMAAARGRVLPLSTK